MGIVTNHREIVLENERGDARSDVNYAARLRFLLDFLCSSHRMPVKRRENVRRRCLLAGQA